MPTRRGASFQCLDVRSTTFDLSHLLRPIEHLPLLKTHSSASQHFAPIAQYRKQNPKPPFISTAHLAAMAGTRSSTRQNDSSPANKSNIAGTKRKADDSSPSSSAKKRGRASKATKEQKTLEQTLPDADDDANGADAKEDESKSTHENGSNHLTEMEDVEPERNGEGESV